MKYLIDGYDKMVGSLAHQYLNLKEGDEYKLFDLDYCDIEGYDVPQISNFLLENGEYKFEKQTDNDPRRMKIATDFNKALDWCDCYVNFINVPRKFAVSENLEITEVLMDEMFDRINLAISKNKKIYFGNLFCEQFEKVAREYPNCINKIITKDDLKALDYYQDSMDNYYWFNRKTKVSMVIGTSSNCGKFSCACLLKKKYEAMGEKVIIIHSEETYPFLNNQNGEIQGFCRNFSELTTDEDFEYFQRLTFKIAAEQHPNRIIFVTQGGFASNVHSTIGSSTVFGKKLENIWDQFLFSSFGISSVAIAANWDKIEKAYRIYDYISNLCGIDFVYLNPVIYDACPITMKAENGEKHYTIYQKGDVEAVKNNAVSLAISLPTTEIICKYNSITNYIKEFKKTEDFSKFVALNLTKRIFSNATYSVNVLPNILKNLEEKVKTEESKNMLEGIFVPEREKILKILDYLRKNIKWI